MKKQYLTVEELIELLSKVENKKAKISVCSYDDDFGAYVLQRGDVKTDSTGGYIHLMIEPLKHELDN